MLVSQSVCLSVSLFVRQSVSQSFSLSDSQSVFQFVQQSVRLWVDPSINQSVFNGSLLVQTNTYSWLLTSLWLSKIFSDYISAGADNKPHFANPAAVQRAASVLGTTKEDITEIIFAPPIVNQFTVRMRRQSQSRNDLSPSSSADNTPERQARSTAVQYIEALEGFAMGLYQEAFAALIRFINR